MMGGLLGLVGLGRVSGSQKTTPLCPPPAAALLSFAVASIEL